MVERVRSGAVAHRFDGPLTRRKNLADSERPLAYELSAEKKEIMAQLGITDFLVTNFRYREYRYTNFDDAVAQARRDLGK